jgi:alpha-L-fucosidase
VAALQSFREILDKEFKSNLVLNSTVSVDSHRGNAKAYSGSNLIDQNDTTYWATDDDVTQGSIVIDLGKETTVKYIVLQEHIALGQRVKQFDVEVWKNDGWTKVSEGTTIGYKRILNIDPTLTSRVQINIRSSRACPLITEIGLY